MQHSLHDHHALPAPLDRARRAGRTACSVAPAGGGGNMSRRAPIIVYIMVVWFVISFVTNLIGPLMPILIGDFHLSLGLAGFLSFSFFLAYGLISIPAGALVEARGPRAKPHAAGGFPLTGFAA